MGNVLKRGISKKENFKKLFLTTTVSVGLSCLSVELREAFEPIYFFSVFL